MFSAELPNKLDIPLNKSCSSIIFYSNQAFTEQCPVTEQSEIFSSFVQRICQNDVCLRIIFLTYIPVADISKSAAVILFYMPQFLHLSLQLNVKWLIHSLLCVFYSILISVCHIRSWKRKIMPVRNNQGKRQSSNLLSYAGQVRSTGGI